MDAKAPSIWAGLHPITQLIEDCFVAEFQLAKLSRGLKRIRVASHDGDCEDGEELQTSL